MMIQKGTEWMDERLGVAKAARNNLNKIFPDHWSFMLGEIALYSFIILLLTGTFLTLFFVPSSHEIVYHGAYAPLRGTKVSEAFASTLNISFSVRAGLVMRQMHHWAANIFIAAIVVHVCRIFFTGSFRKPREINWVIGTLLMILAIVNGFLGYSLPDDLVSGTGLRIAFSILESIPLVGSYLAFFVFGGNFPGGGEIIPRFYVIHVLLVPGIIIALLAAHLGIMYHQKHTQMPGRRRTNRNVVGKAFWPGYALEAGGFFFIVSGVIAALGGLVQINPVWLYGSYVPYQVSYAVQPDWYMGWLDGALRLMPSWEITAFGHMIPNVFFPAILLPGITFNILGAWPWIEKKITKDNSEHNICDRPRDVPWRTSLGVGILTFYIVLFFASSNDVLANLFNTSLNFVLWTFRIILIVLPPIAAYVTYLICKEVQGNDVVGRRKVASVIVRSAEGAFSTIEADKRNQPTFVEPVVLEEEGGPGSSSGRHTLIASSGRPVETTTAGISEELGPQRSGGTGVLRIPRRSSGSRRYGNANGSGNGNGIGNGALHDDDESEA